MGVQYRASWALLREHSVRSEKLFTGDSGHRRHFNDSTGHRDLAWFARAKQSLARILTKISFGPIPQLLQSTFTWLALVSSWEAALLIVDRFAVN